MQILDPIQHGAQRTDFSLQDRSCSFDIHNHAVVGVDQIVGRITKERRAFARRCLLACRIRMGCKLGLNLRCCAKGCVVQDIQILFHSTRGIIWINGAAIPIFLRCGVLLVRIGFDQTGICREALTAHEAICNATRHKWRSKSLSRKRPCRFLEKVEWLGTGSARSRRQNQR